MNHLTAAGRVALVAILLYAAVLVAMAVGLPPETFKPLFTESGPFEQMSILLWLLLGLVLLLPLGLPTAPRLAMAALALLFAAREADLHKRYTSMSLAKIKFYLSPDVALPEKLLGGLVLLGSVALIVYLAHKLYRYVRYGQGLRSSPGQVMVLAALMLPVSKVIDRFSSQLYEMFEIVLPPLLQRLIAAFEEGMEMAMPVLFLVALLLFWWARRGGRVLDALTPPPAAAAPRPDRRPGRA